jgi:transposase
MRSHPRGKVEYNLQQEGLSVGGHGRKIFKEYRQDQNFLLPPSLDEFVPEDHEVRIINDVVDTLDSSLLLGRYEGGGAPAYHPAMMLKVIIYAYSLGIYSSRRIAQELKTDTAFMFLSGLQAPDFRTICLFRAQHASILPDLFVEVVRLCASLGMVGLGHIAFDGTKLKANAALRQSRDRDSLEKEIECIKEQVRQMIEASTRLDESEEQEHPDGDGSEMLKELRKKEYRLKKLNEARETLQRGKLKRVNITDPESRLMQDSRKAIQPSYNGQIAVDENEQVIVAADITQETTDHHEFRRMVEVVEQNLGALPKEASADAGYSSYENLEYAQQKGLDAYIPDDFFLALEKKDQAEKRYHKSNFQYDQTRDVYICPEGRNLRRYQELKRQGKPPFVIYRGESCRGCAVKEVCTTGPARRITRDGRERLVEVMREKLRSEEGREIYKKRLYTVEPVMGDLKWNRMKPALSLRGLEKVRGEFCLMCLVHNVKKITKRVLEGSVPWFSWHKVSQMTVPARRLEDMTLARA